MARPAWAQAEAAGLKVLTASEAAKAADVTMVLVPDHIQSELYEKELAQHMKPAKGADAGQQPLSLAQIAEDSK